MMGESQKLLDEYAKVADNEYIWQITIAMLNMSVRIRSFFLLWNNNTPIVDSG